MQTSSGWSAAAPSPRRDVPCSREHEENECVRTIFHIVPADQWDAQDTQPYRAASLATEGFIHCSNRDQLAGVANLFYASHADLLVLHLDAERLTSPLHDDDIGTGETFPHIYGPINRAAITTIEPLGRDANGRWVF
jgi:uncharacterized protein (DUF952 family)